MQKNLLPPPKTNPTSHTAPLLHRPDDHRRVLRLRAVAVMLKRATRPTLRRPKENLPDASTPTPNARSKRRRPKTFELAQKPRAGVRLTELLGGGAHLLATPPDEVKMPEPQVL
jgi:hypothetical protein